MSMNLAATGYAAAIPSSSFDKPTVSKIGITCFRTQDERAAS